MTAATGSIATDDDIAGIEDGDAEVVVDLEGAGAARRAALRGLSAVAVVV